MSRRRAVWVNDAGHTVGEDHHRSKLTDHEVELVRELRAGGMPVRVIAEKFEIAEYTVRRYCNGKSRNQFAIDQKFLPPRGRRRGEPRRRPARPDEFEALEP